MLQFVSLRFRLNLAFGIVLAALAAKPAAAANYSVVDITPPGFTYGSIGAVANGLAAGGISTGTIQPDVTHAGIWTGTPGAAMGFTDLHPTSLGFVNSFIAHSDGTQHVGNGTAAYGNPPIHALLWTGNTAASVVDLHPTGAVVSRAFGVGNGRQAGMVGYGGPGHAALWSGTAGSFVDLHPSGLYYSEAYDTNASQQVGQTLASSTSRGRAALWTGTAASYVSLHPTSGYSETAAVAIDGTRQVGWGTASGNSHALMWSGTAASVVDMHPSGYLSSGILSATDGWQFGWAKRLVSATERPQYAAAWNGTANSVINLGELLPEGYGNSFAIGRDAAGNFYGGAWVTPPGGPPGGGYRAIAWIVPEPGTFGLLTMAVIAAAARRSRRN